MKSTIQLLSISTVLILGSLTACKQQFLDLGPQGVYNESDLLSKKGIDGFLINAYASLDGSQTASTLGFSGSYNWIWGSITGGDAYKAGVNFTDQGELNQVMQYATPSTNAQILTRWNGIFDGVGRANVVLQELAKTTDPALTATMRKQVEAEARFLRAFHHFEGKKIFGNIPFVDEKATDYKIPNTDASGNYINIWPTLETEFRYAYDNLDEVKTGKGRANKWTAGAYLAKVYLYQNKFTEAKALFDMIIAQGKNSQGAKLDLMAGFGENFRIATQNNRESLLEVQSAIGDGATNSTNGFREAILCYPNGIAGGTNSWFYRPSQNLVNAFRTDATGLPMPDTYNDVEVTSYEAIPDASPFTPYAGNLDPRLDHTVGRRGIPYLDWGMMTGVAFTAPPGESIANGGPYSGKKHVFSQAELSAGYVTQAGFGRASALNYAVMRFADVLLMAAECEVEVGSLDKAREYVNRVRTRAAASVIKSLDGSANAAQYVVNQYTTAWASKEDARKAVRFERRLELGMEGHRFFDLVRWGIADQVINNEYLPKEAVRRPLILGSGVKFTKNKSEYQPIPDYVITQSFVDGKPTLKQNPGY